MAKFKIPLGSGKSVTVNVPFLKTAKEFVDNRLDTMKEGMGSLDADDNTINSAKGKVKGRYDSIDALGEALDNVGHPNPGGVFDD